MGPHGVAGVSKVDQEVERVRVIEVEFHLVRDICAISESENRRYNHQE